MSLVRRRPIGLAGETISILAAAIFDLRGRRGSCGGGSKVSFGRFVGWVEFGAVRARLLAVGVRREKGRVSCVISVSNINTGIEGWMRVISEYGLRLGCLVVGRAGMKVEYCRRLIRYP